MSAENINELDWEDTIALTQEEVKRAVSGLSEQYEDFCWWIPEDMGDYRCELIRELPKGHPLEGRELMSLARSECNDDVLFHDGCSYICVHFTWSDCNFLPFPLFENVEGNIADYLRNYYLENAN